MQATRDYEQIAREILERGRRGRCRGGRALRRRARRRAARASFRRAQGRRGWLREAKRRLDERRAEEARPIPGSRPERLKEAKRRLEEEHQVECDANAAYEDYRARGRDEGRPAASGARPKPVPAAAERRGQDQPQRPGLAQRQDARAAGCRATTPRLVTTADQIVIAAEVNVDSPDFGHLEPMVAAARAELERRGRRRSRPAVVLADAGYWHQVQMERLVERRACRC